MGTTKFMPGTFQQAPYWKLRARFHEYGYRDGEAAAAIGLTPGAVSQKMTGRAQWRRCEIVRLCELLDIGQEEIGELFFPEVESKKKEPAGAANTRRLRIAVR